MHSPIAMEGWWNPPCHKFQYSSDAWNHPGLEPWPLHPWFLVPSIALLPQLPHLLQQTGGGARFGIQGHAHARQSPIRELYPALSALSSFDLKALQNRSFLLKSTWCGCAPCNMLRHSRVLVEDWVLLLATLAPFKLLSPLTVLHCATQHIETIHVLLMLCQILNLLLPLPVFKHPQRTLVAVNRCLPPRP